jgi:hypothetical protein
VQTFATRAAARAKLAAWTDDYVRHEALFDRVEVRDLRRLAVAAAWTAPALWHLHGSYKEAGQSKINSIRVSTLSAEPRLRPGSSPALSS